MKILLYLHLAIVVGLPVLVPNISPAERTVYWLSISGLAIFFGFLWVVANQLDLKVLSNKNPVSINKPLPGLFIWYSLFLLTSIGLILIVDLEFLPMLKAPVNSWIEICKHFIPVLNRYPDATYLTSTKYAAQFTELSVFKTQATTSLAITFGLISLIYFSACAIWNKGYVDRTNRIKEMRPIMKIGGAFLAILSIWMIFSGESELRLHPSGRDICITNFYCYGGDNLLIFLAAYFKFLGLLLLPLGSIVVLKETFSPSESNL